ncbi:MAG TPA: hypothetical protein VL359_06055, partial [bacterium]|nr:hypothetical protein [bacterium]
MPEIVYPIIGSLEAVLFSVPIGTNLALAGLLWALMSGRFLSARGGVYPALLSLGLTPQAVRRGGAALAYGCWQIADLLEAWQKRVQEEGAFEAQEHEGVRPVACDLVGFFRARLAGCVGKHYHAQADKALPAVVMAMVGAVGKVGKVRLALPRLLLRQAPEEGCEADLQRRAVCEAAQTLAPQEALVVDAGFGVKQLLDCEVPRFVARADSNFTARRNYLPERKPRGRPAEYGQIVRPLARTRAGKTIEASKPDAEVSWQEGKRTVCASLWKDLTLSSHKPGGESFACAVIRDPRYREPWVLLVYGLAVSARAVRDLYRDRWPIEQLPLAAKQMLGAERAFVFGEESRHRLPELALLAGHLLAYAAAQ